MLSISDLYVAVENKHILHGVTLHIEPGTVHTLMGPNGSGKSTLAYAIAGHPRYTILRGSIVFNGEEITHITPDERARKGLFVSFQHVPSIPGLTVFSFLKESYRAISGKCIDSAKFRDLLLKQSEIISLNVSFLERSLYDGFSGGEKKRLELLQLLLFNPKMAILDEIDTGVDIDSRRCIVNGLQEVRKNNPKIGIIIITHYHHMLRYIQPDYVHVLQEGKIIQSGDYLLGEHIAQHGYQQYKNP